MMRILFASLYFSGHYKFQGVLHLILFSLLRKYFVSSFTNFAENTKRKNEGR